MSKKEKEKKISRKELRKMQQRVNEIEKIQSGVNGDEFEYNGMSTNKSTLHDLLAPSGIDATHYDYLEIFSKISRFARTFYVTNYSKTSYFSIFLITYI